MFKVNTNSGVELHAVLPSVLDRREYRHVSANRRASDLPKEAGGETIRKLLFNLDFKLFNLEQNHDRLGRFID